MGPIRSHMVAACFAFASATAAAVLLWGVGSEAVHFGDYLQGGLLLASALIVTMLESLTALQYVEWRRTRRHQSVNAATVKAPSAALRRVLIVLDEYRRAAVYIVLAVPCFVHVRRVWLPVVPGAVLLLSAALYTSKYCCALRRQRTLVKVPTFVRFKGESVSAESRDGDLLSAAAAAASGASAAAAESGLSHQSSFTSSHSGRSLQMGSRDSGIEASQRDCRAEAKAPPPPRRAAKGLARANSSSPDRCCIINEDSLSLRE